MVGSFRVPFSHLSTSGEPEQISRFLMTREKGKRQITENSTCFSSPSNPLETHRELNPQLLLATRCHFVRLVPISNQASSTLNLGDYFVPTMQASTCPWKWKRSSTKHFFTSNQNLDTFHSTFFRQSSTNVPFVAQFTESFISDQISVIVAEKLWKGGVMMTSHNKGPRVVLFPSLQINRWMENSERNRGGWIGERDLPQLRWFWHLLPRKITRRTWPDHKPHFRSQSIVENERIQHSRKKKQYDCCPQLPLEMSHDRLRRRTKIYDIFKVAG